MEGRLILVIGLTGGIGSGKSMALKEFEKLGAKVVDADKLAREVVEPGQPAWKEIKEAFGKSVFFSNNRLNRKKLAKKVFSDKEALETLNKIIHPHVLELEQKLEEQFAKKDKNAIIVVDAPMMIESGFHKLKDVLVIMNTTKENQIDRMRGKNGLTKKDVENRINAQMPLEKKLAYADYVIDNNGTLSQGRSNAAETYKLILKNIKRILRKASRE